MQHTAKGLANALPASGDGREVAANIDYTVCVSGIEEPELKPKKSPKRLKKSLKLAATKPLSRNPWTLTSG